MLMSSAQETMEVQLGKVQRVRAIDDGGISFRFQREFGSSLRSQRVILSVEVKPLQIVLMNLGKAKKARQRERWRYSKPSCRSNICWNARSSVSSRILRTVGQWIPGGTCLVSPRLWQQSFVIHIRHARIQLFYAKLPNTYLSRVEEHGARYSEKYPENKVKLCHSRHYSMKYPEDQAAFYRVLTKLLWYLGSEKSHVGYLCRCLRNPLVMNSVLPILDEIFVQVPQFREGDYRCFNYMNKSDLSPPGSYK